MNENHRPEGYLQAAAGPPTGTMRPFVARRTVAPARPLNHAAPLPAAGESYPVPDEWCYRCFMPGHADHYVCWPEIRPVTPMRGAQLVALSARAAAGVPLALASWSPGDESFMLDVAAEIVKAADAATDARIRRAARADWTTGDPKRPDVGLQVERFGRVGTVVEPPADFAPYLVPVVFETEPSIVVGYPIDEWPDLVPLELVE